MQSSLGNSLPCVRKRENFTYRYNLHDLNEGEPVITNTDSKARLNSNTCLVLYWVLYAIVSHRICIQLEPVDVTLFGSSVLCRSS